MWMFSEAYLRACRNILPSRTGRRMWVEVTEPMMRAYAFWRVGSIQTDGFGTFMLLSPQGEHSASVVVAKAEESRKRKR